MSATKTLLFILGFVFYYPANAQRFSVVITEIMADPTPVVGLANAEYIEIKNRSSAPIDLSGWKLQTSGNTSSSFPSYVLQPDSFVVLASRTNAPQFGSNVMGISSFPALANEGIMVSLLSGNGSVIHAVAYKADWYRNAVKKEGGWSLEMIDEENFCAGSSNWMASTDEAGGTPGWKNSVAGTTKDEAAPVLLGAYTTDSLTIVLQFDEPLDSSRVADRHNYTLNPQRSIASVSVQTPEQTQVHLQLQEALNGSEIYTLTVSSVADCAGNPLDSKQIQIGLPQQATALDVVVNEILFNPKPNASDYIELFNRSSKIIDVRHLYLGQRSTNRVVSSALRISEDAFYLFPGSYLVLTEDKESLQRMYHVKQPAAVLELSTLPSLPDDEGSVVLLNQQGVVIDEVAYSKNWHFALVSNAEGVTLERIDPGSPSQDRNNWTSAAATAGYGTPTYNNSQYKQVEHGGATIDVTPNVFSPDNDGYDDRAMISYRLNEHGFVANVQVFDVQGRPVRHLVKNETLSAKGSWVWDGLGEQKQALPVGMYIVYTELFNLKGKRERFRQTVVLARRLR